MPAIIPRPLVVLTVYGTPGTAGSKNATPIYKGTGPERVFTGRTNVYEQPSETKKGWRAAVRAACVEFLRCPCDMPGCVAQRAGFPLDEALVGSMVFTVQKPINGDTLYPSGKPDLTKYVRATEDHMTSAGIMRDDARIVEFGRQAKVYPGSDPDALDRPGALIVLWSRFALPRWVRRPGPQPVPISTVHHRPRQGALFDA